MHSVRAHTSLLAIAAHALPAMAGVIPTPPLPTEPCTTYLTSVLYGFRGSFQAQIAKTIYSSTITQVDYVPCGGCQLATVYTRAPFWGGIGPAERVTGTVTATLPTTTTTTVCSPTLTHLGPPPPQIGEVQEVKTTSVSSKEPEATKPAIEHQTTAGPLRSLSPPIPFPPFISPASLDSSSRPSGSDNCTFTKIVGVPGRAGGIDTVYTATATTTSHIDCDGCKYVSIFPLNGFNPGPVIFFTATSTAKEPSYATVYQCLKTPSVVNPSDPTPPPKGVGPRGPAMVLATITLTITETVYQATATAASKVMCVEFVTTAPGAIVKRTAVPEPQLRRGGAELVEKRMPQNTILAGTSTVYEHETLLVPGTSTVFSLVCTATTTRVNLPPVAGFTDLGK